MGNMINNGDRNEDMLMGGNRQGNSSDGMMIINMQEKPRNMDSRKNTIISLKQTKKEK